MHRITVGRGRDNLLLMSGLASSSGTTSRISIYFQPARPFRQQYLVGFDNRFASEQNAPRRAASDEDLPAPAMLLPLAVGPDRPILGQAARCPWRPRCSPAPSRTPSSRPGAPT